MISSVCGRSCASSDMSATKRSPLTTSAALLTASVAGHTDHSADIQGHASDGGADRTTAAPTLGRAHTVLAVCNSVALAILGVLQKTATSEASSHERRASRRTR